MRFLFLYLFLSLGLFITVTKATAETTLSKNGMAVSEVKVASQIGANIMREGGTAIDAAVAMAYALAVVNPCCGNIGGGGFMLIHTKDGENIFLNFREKAPGKASSTMFLDQTGNLMKDKSTGGYLAVAVPGTVLGLEKALSHYGTMNREQLMRPAIQLAEEGFIVSPYLAKQLNEHAKQFSTQANIAAIFLKKNGQPYNAGERLVQKDLAHTLKLISQHGSDAFYKKEIAEKIVAASNKQGGILTLNDFANYNVEKREPIYCRYRNYSIISAPPPSSGGVTLCEMLNILENFPLAQLGHLTPESMRIIIEAMRYGFNDRNAKLGDPNFVENPIEHLTSKTYARELAENIKTNKKPKTEIKIMAPELSDTTHFSVIDNKGNAVSLTYTLNGFFGAGIIAENTGFFLNNEMDDFSAKTGVANKFGLVQSDVNNIQAYKRPLSSMTPTIVMKDGKIVMILGSPGGPRIITAVLLTLLNKIDYQMSLDSAVNATRLHFQVIPNEVYIENDNPPKIAINKLTHLGYKVVPQKIWGAVEAISISPDNLVEGVNDKRRRDGAAVGY